MPTPALSGALEIDDDGFLGGFVGYVDYVEDVLQITRPRRNSNTSSATWKTPNIGLEISADQGHAKRAHEIP